MEWQKLMEVEIGLRDGSVHASAVVVLTFASVKCQDGKWKIEGKSGEICGMQFFFLVFLSFWTVRTYPKLKQQQKIRFRRRVALFEQKRWLRFWAKRKSVTDFGKIRHRLWENETPTLGKWATDFGEIRHRLWENLSPTLGKSVTDFGKMSHWFWGNPSPILRKSVTDYEEIRHRFWGNPSLSLRKSVTDFGEIRCRFWGNPSPILWKSVTEIRCRFWGNPSPTLGKNWLGFGETLARFWGKTGSIWGKTFWFLNWLATKLKSHYFEREACLGLDLLFF